MNGDRYLRSRIPPEEYRKRLETLGDLKVFDSMPSSLEELISRVKDADIVVLGGRYGFPKDTFNASRISI